MCNTRRAFVFYYRPSEGAKGKIIYETIYIYIYVRIIANRFSNVDYSKNNRRFIINTDGNLSVANNKFVLISRADRRLSVN